MLNNELIKDSLFAGIILILLGILLIINGKGATNNMRYFKISTVSIISGIVMLLI